MNGIDVLFGFISNRHNKTVRLLPKQNNNDFGICCHVFLKEGNDKKIVNNIVKLK